MQSEQEQLQTDILNNVCLYMNATLSSIDSRGSLTDLFSIPCMWICDVGVYVYCWASLVRRCCETPWKCLQDHAHSSSSKTRRSGSEKFVMKTQADETKRENKLRKKRGRRRKRKWEELARCNITHHENGTFWKENARGSGNWGVKKWEIIEDGTWTKELMQQ